MDFNSLFTEPFYTIGGQPIGMSQILWMVMLLSGLLITYRVLIRRFFIPYIQKQAVNPIASMRIKRLVQTFFLLLGIIVVLRSLGVDFPLINNENLTLNISTLFIGLLVFQMARLINWLFGNIFLPNFFNSEKEAGKTTKRQYDRSLDEAPEFTIQYIVYIVALLLILYNFNLDYQLYEFGEDSPLRISNVLYALLILFSARVLSWAFIRLFLKGFYERQQIHVGTQFAINQLLRYIVFIIAILMAVEALNINLTLLWAGSATILLGIGLGLQQTFTDLISGIVLLFESTLEVGAIIELEDGLVGEVRSIGWRTSEVETRDGITVIVPNSNLISNNVTNWSHSGDKARFYISTGVAYGSDTALVKRVLLEVAKSHSMVLNYPAPKIRFTDFGDSSLHFDLLFWSRNFMIIEDIKSDLRFEIDRVFREHGIEIPFPQRDVWIKGGQS